MSIAEHLAESGMTNLTDVWGDKPAGDVSNAGKSEAIADSLLDDDNIVGDHRNPTWFEQTENSFEDDEPREDLAEAEGEPEQFDADALGKQFADQYEHEQILNEAQASFEEQQQEQSAPITTETLEAELTAFTSQADASHLYDDQAARPSRSRRAQENHRG